MEEQIGRLVNKVWSKYLTINDDERFLIAISGIPGSGKTTLAKTVAQRLNDLSAGGNGQHTVPPTASYIPMDGYHLSRAQLDLMPDPKHAHDRRGAAFTFDGDAFLTLLRTIRKPINASTPTYYAPSFDHAIKDPINNDIPIPPTSRIVVFEGNYLSLDQAPWKDVSQIVDENWFVDVDFDTAGKRLVPRHVAAGIAENEELAWKRVRENDLVNGREIVDFRGKIDEIVVSVEDLGFT